MFAEAEAVDQQEDELYGKEHDGDELPDDLKKAFQRKEKITQLLTELQAQETNKMSLIDKEARFMKFIGGRRYMSYNAQCVSENQVILACEVTNSGVPTMAN